MARLNLLSAGTELDPEAEGWGVLRFGLSLGATQIVGNVWDLAPGVEPNDYHYEFPDEEWLVVLSGRPTLRTPVGREELSPGDVVVFPPGPDGAHQLANDTSEPARVLMFSPKSPTGITVYPDLGRVNAMAGDQDLPLVLQRDGGDLHYYEHEG